MCACACVYLSSGGRISALRKARAKADTHTEQQTAQLSTKAGQGEQFASEASN